MRKWGEHPNDGKGLLRVSKMMLHEDKPMNTPVLTNPVSDDRLRNTRAWAAARVGTLSGAEVIVAAIDEVFALRTQLAASCDEARSDPEHGGCPLEKRAPEPTAECTHPDPEHYYDTGELGSCFYWCRECGAFQSSDEWRLPTRRLAAPPANASALKCPTCKRPFEEVKLSELREYFEPAAKPANPLHDGTPMCLNHGGFTGLSKDCPTCNAPNRPAPRMIGDGLLGVCEHEWTGIEKDDRGWNRLWKCEKCGSTTDEITNED